MFEDMLKDVFEELIEEHGLTKMTKVISVAIGMAIVGAAGGYLVSMIAIPDDRKGEI